MQKGPVITTLRHCPVCDAGPEQARLFLAENIDPSRFSPLSFSSRKEPEYMCHRLVTCPECGLVYADRPPGEDALAAAYHQADYDSTEEANDAAASYLRAIRPTLRLLARRHSALEIGAGTGIFLEYLAGEGFTELAGVEPSAAAIAAAPEHRRAWIREAMFDEQDYAPESFDLICCFMTLEHVPFPKLIAASAMRLLRPGGALVTVTHDYRGLVNRVLGRRSPIIDIEHLQLFSAPSIRRLFADAGYADITVNTYRNSYSLRYWLRIAPLPPAIKHGVTRLMAQSRLDRIKLSVNVGNQLTAGFKRG